MTEKIYDRPDLFCVCVCVCVSLTSDSSETIEVVVIKLGMVTAPYMRMHYMLIILTMTFNQPPKGGRGISSVSPLSGISGLPV